MHLVTGVLYENPAVVPEVTLCPSATLLNKAWEAVYLLRSQPGFMSTQAPGNEHANSRPQCRPSNSLDVNYNPAQMGFQK